MMLIESVFVVTQSGLSVLDGHGAGQITMYTAALACILLYEGTFGHDTPLTFIGLYLKTRRRSMAGFLTFAATSSLISSVAIAIMIAMDSVEFSPEAIASLTKDTIVALLISLPIAAVLALVEESMFRAFMMRYLRWNSSLLTTVFAILFSSFIFALVHNLTDLLGWLEPKMIRLFIGLFVLGAMLSVVYISTGSLFCAAGLHAGFLFVEHARRYTHSVAFTGDHWWMAVDGDVRTAPITWLLFALIGLGIFLVRHKLHPKFAIEKQVIASSDVSEPFASTPR